MTTTYGTLTPYIIPPRLHGRKVVNIGDGFILRAIERCLGRFHEDLVLTGREKPPPAAMAGLEQCDAVVLAGANQLNDDFTVWPGATAEDVRAMGPRFVPFGIGLHGEPGYNDGLSETARAQILAIHERVEYSSWRCPNTVAYLEKHVPELRGRFLMTGCPVTFNAPLLEGDAFHPGEDNVAVTVTERGDFWKRELTLLEEVAHLFPKARKTLVLHQDFDPMPANEADLPTEGAFAPPPQSAADLRRRARALGYVVIAPATADEAIAFYRHVDIHIGSRLHAHLFFLSRARRSWLVPVDGRSTGMADCLGFPLVAPDNLASALTYDFETVRRRARETFETMSLFLRSLPR